jgi:mediator of RNA polymerase II transcription subunit 16
MPGYPGSSSQNGTPNAQQPIPSLSPALRAAYLKIATLTASAILRIKTFEALLSGVANSIKTAYSNHTPPLSGSPNAEKARNAIEIKMLFGGSLPDAFVPVITELFRPSGLLAAVRDDIEPARLFFADFAMLELDDDAAALARRRRAARTMDCFRKAWLPNPHPRTRDEPDRAARHGVRWRRCARCAAVMEDVLSQRQALQWLVMQQRRCFCSGYWDTLQPGETAA